MTKRSRPDFRPTLPTRTKASEVAQKARRGFCSTGTPTAHLTVELPEKVTIPELTAILGVPTSAVVNILDREAFFYAQHMNKRPQYIDTARLNEYALDYARAHDIAIELGFGADARNLIGQQTLAPPIGWAAVAEVERANRDKAHAIVVYDSPDRIMGGALPLTIGAPATANDEPHYFLPQTWLANLAASLENTKANNPQVVEQALELARAQIAEVFSYAEARQKAGHIGPHIISTPPAENLVDPIDLYTLPESMRLDKFCETLNLDPTITMRALDLYVGEPHTLDVQTANALRLLMTKRVINAAGKYVAPSDRPLAFQPLWISCPGEDDTVSGIIDLKREVPTPPLREDFRPAPRRMPNLKELAASLGVPFDDLQPWVDRLLGTEKISQYRRITIPAASYIAWFYYPQNKAPLPTIIGSNLSDDELPEVTVEIPERTTVNQLALLLRVRPGLVSDKLRQFGVQITEYNQPIDRAAATLIAVEFGYGKRTAEPKPLIFDTALNRLTTNRNIAVPGVVMEFKEDEIAAKDLAARLGIKTPTLLRYLEAKGVTLIPTTNIDRYAAAYIAYQFGLARHADGATITEADDALLAEAVADSMGTVEPLEPMLCADGCPTDLATLQKFWRSMQHPAFVPYEVLRTLTEGRILPTVCSADNTANAIANRVGKIDLANPYDARATMADLAALALDYLRRDDARHGRTPATFLPPLPERPFLGEPGAHLEPIGRDELLRKYRDTLLWIWSDVWPLVHGLTSRNTLRERFKQLPDLINWPLKDEPTLLPPDVAYFIHSADLAKHLHMDAQGDWPVSDSAKACNKQRAEKILEALFAVRTAHPYDPARTSYHSDDAAVDKFAQIMKQKLAEARAKGRSGWDDPDECTVQFLSDLLREHVEKGDPRDVANLAMMLYLRGSGILPHSEGQFVNVLEVEFLGNAGVSYRPLRDLGFGMRKHGEKVQLFVHSRYLKQ